MYPIISIKDVRKVLHSNGKEFCILNDISLDIESGKILGLVGESGCGKTTLAKTIIGLYKVDHGSISYQGRIVNPSSKKHYTFDTSIQMVFQDPVASLNPRLTIAQSINDMLDHKQKKNVDTVLKIVGLNPEYKKRYPYELSGGQLQRVNIARALAFNPKILICDEIISALDLSLQAQIVNILLKLQQEQRLTVLFISHDLYMVQHISDNIAVMFSGEIVEYGCAGDVYDNPQHPYTKLLYGLQETSIVEPVCNAIQNNSINNNNNNRCVFWSRCPYALDKCKLSKPILKKISNTHSVACFLKEQ